MTIFSDSPETFQRLDWQILQNGWTSMYLKQSILDNDIKWFERNGYRTFSFDCKTWKSEHSMHKEFKEKLNFPDYYGHNLSALNDCLSDLPMSVSGAILVFKYFDNLDKKLGHTLIDIIASNSRRHILLGKKLITLIQVDNPKFNIEIVGACPVCGTGRNG